MNLHKRMIVLLVSASVVAVISRPAAPAVAHSGTGTAHLEIDMDPTNGTGPCNPVDASRSIEVGQQFDVSLCLDDALSPPINGALSEIILEVDYSPQLSGMNRVDDGVFDRNANPDFKENATVDPTGWDCNLANVAVSAPTASPAPAMLACQTGDVVNRALPNAVTALATLTLNAASTGTGTIAYSSTWPLTYLGWDPGGEADCGISIVCTGGTVTVIPATHANVTGFHLTRYTITGSSSPNFACGSQIYEVNSSLNGTIDCTTGTGGVLTGTISNASSPNPVSGTVTFTRPPSQISFSGTVDNDGNSGSGTWTCVSGCGGSGTYTDQRIAPQAQECAAVSAGPPGPVHLVNSHGDELFIAANSMTGSGTRVCSQIINLPLGVASGANILSRAYELTPHGTTFNPPATAVYHYAADEIVPGMTESNLKVVVFDSLQNRWRARSATVDTLNHTLTVSLDHFSVWGGFECGSGPDTDGAFSNGPTIAGDDTTVPNGDGVRNVCDVDSDNDGRLDVEELAGTGCPSASGDKKTDVTTSNGYSGITGSPPPAHPSWDTDGDTVPDGVECQVGTDPKTYNATDRTACAAFFGSSDADGDGLSAAIEKCKWMSVPTLADSDGDGMGDCKEAYDVNGNGVMNTADATLVLRAFFLLDIGDMAAEDVNGNGAVNTADATLIKRAFFGLDPCM